MYKSVVSISLLCAFFTFVFTNDVAGFTGFNEQEVTIRWAGERSVIIHIGDDEFAARPGQDATTLLPAETALVVKVETPSETYHAEEFLLVQPGKDSLITLMIAGEHVRITYGEDAETEQPPTEIADSVPEEPAPGELQEPDANDRFDVYETTRGMMISELDPVFAMELWMIRFFTNTVKFRNIERVDDLEWSMQELYARRTSEGEITELVWSGSGSIVMNENEDEITIQSSNPDTGMNTPAYTCVRLD
jgi:hypothetical protein